MERNKLSDGQLADCEMTKKEAIKILKNYHNGYFGYKIDDVHKAHNLAIKALEEEPKQGKFECHIKIKDLISMLLEFDMNEIATIHAINEYKENNIIISITDMRGKEE
jgi:hypothetical protein